MSRWKQYWSTTTLESVHAFNKLYESFAPLRKATTPEEVLVTLNNYSFGGTTGIAKTLEGFKNEAPWALPTTGRAGDYDFSTWTKTNFPARKDKTVPIASLSYELKEAADWLLVYWGEATKIGGGIDEELLNTNNYFIIALDKYKNGIQKMLNLIYPPQFKHAGFRIENPDHLAKPVVNELLGGIDFLKNWFKSKGLLKILEEGIPFFKLEMESPDQDLHSRKTGAYYSVDKHYISIMASTAFHSNLHGLLDSWVKQVFLHEFGHYLHLAYITGEAKAFWDSWWDKVNEVRGLQRYTQPITQEERQHYYKGLKKDRFRLNWNKPRANSIQQHCANIRYNVWLSSLEYDRESLFKQPRDYTRPPIATELGDDVFSFLADPLYGLREAKDKAQFKKDVFQKEVLYEDIFGIKDSYPEPRIPKEAQQAMFKDLTPEEQMIDELGIPSGYGRTNEEEDFAESFVLFVTQPRRLSPLAQYRMKRTLSLSGLYGKSVMKFAGVVEELLQEGMTDEAMEILTARLNNRPDTQEILVDHVLAIGSLERAIKSFEKNKDKVLYLTNGEKVKSGDLANELKQWRPQHTKGNITVYHSTTKENAKFILENGVIPEMKPWTLAARDFAQRGDTGYWKPGTGLERGLYVGTSKNTSGYGPVTLSLQVPFKYLTLPAEAKVFGHEDIKEVLEQTEHGAIIKQAIHPRAIRKV